MHKNLSRASLLLCCAIFLCGCRAKETYTLPPAQPLGSPGAPWLQNGTVSTVGGALSDAAATVAPAWTMPPLPDPTPTIEPTLDTRTPLPLADGAAELAEGERLYNEGKYEEAFDKLQQSAALGNFKAAYRMALCQQEGKGITQSDKKAADLMRRAANGGVIEAMAAYGEMLLDGRGTDKNPEEAVRWMEKSAEAGNMDAVGRLGRCYKDGTGVDVNGEKAAKWLKVSADAGDADAAVALGELYYNGVLVPKDRDAAMKYYGKAADAGNVDAMFIAGVMLTETQAKSDEEKAKAKQGFSYICRGADKEDPRCEFYLGALLYNGTNTEKDENLGIRFFIKAAQKGYTRAIKTLDQLEIMPEMVIDVHEMAKNLEKELEDKLQNTPPPEMYTENTPAPWVSVSDPFPDAGDEGVTVENVGRLRPGETYEDVVKVFHDPGTCIIDVNEFKVYTWSSSEVPSVRITFEDGMLWEMTADDGVDMHAADAYPTNAAKKS